MARGRRNEQGLVIGSQCAFVSEDSVRCERLVFAKELCRAHYLQKRRGEKLRPAVTPEWKKGTYARRRYALKNFLS